MLLHERFVRVAKRHGDKLFIIDRSSNRRVTYSKALIASLILAKEFRKFEPGRVGIMIPTSAGCALSIIASLMSGHTPVMINYAMGAAHNAEFAQKKCFFKTIITSRVLLEKIDCRFVKGMVFIEDIVKGISRGGKIRAALQSKFPTPLLLKHIHRGNDDDDLVILFTSGSEKAPKAVQLTHRNIVSNVESLTAAFNLSENDSVLANLPYFHAFGQTANLWIPIYHGMTIITYANPLDSKMICAIAREEKPSLMVGTPSFYRGYLRKSNPGDFESVRLAVIGADKCPETLRRGFWEKHKISLLEAYGATETSPAISTNTPEFNRPGSVGRVLPHVRVRIEDYETGQECAEGEMGKVLVAGDLVMKGYLDDFEETTLRVRSGWYDTGDMGLMDEDGYLWHVGRLRRFVKIGGEMISLVRVEEALENVLPEDVSCCVVEIPDAMRGAKIVAVVTQRVDERHILKLLATQLPKIALPKQFVIIEELPETGSGKTDFRKITEMVRDMVCR